MFGADRINSLDQQGSEMSIFHLFLSLLLLPQVIIMVFTEAPFIQPKCYQVNSKSLLLNFVIDLFLGLAFLIAQGRPLWGHGLSTLVYPLPSSATYTGLSILRYVNTINVTILWKTAASFTVIVNSQSFKRVLDSLPPLVLFRRVYTENAVWVTENAVWVLRGLQAMPS